MDNNLNQDLTLEKLDKLTAEGKIKSITMTVTSIDDGTRTVIHADKSTIVSISQSPNGVVTGDFMFFPPNNNLSDDEYFDEEESTNDEYEDELNTPFDSDDGIYLDEEDELRQNTNGSLE